MKFTLLNNKDMKKYTVTIEVEENKANNSFIDNLVSEVNDEKKQLSLTHKINEETSLLHKRILNDITDSIDVELNKVDLGFMDAKFDSGSGNNEYHNSIAELLIPSIKKGVSLCIIGKSKRTDFSKYTTFMGHYELRMGFSSHARGGWKYLPLYDAKTIVKSNDDIFKELQEYVKEHIIETTK